MSKVSDGARSIDSSKDKWIFVSHCDDLDILSAYCGRPVKLGIISVGGMRK